MRRGQKWLAGEVSVGARRQSEDKLYLLML